MMRMGVGTLRPCWEMKFTTNDTQKKCTQNSCQIHFCSTRRWNGQKNAALSLWWVWRVLVGLMWLYFTMTIKNIQLSMFNVYTDPMWQEHRCAAHNINNPFSHHQQLHGHTVVNSKVSSPSCLSMCSFEPPSMATGVTRAPSHFPTSLYQFRTRLEGDTTMTLSISGFASGLWRSRVHMRVMHCRVFPRPISSAMMQPYDSEILLPVTHSQRNFTPWNTHRHTTI